MAEQDATQNKQEHIDTDDPSSKDCSSDKDGNVHPGPAWAPPVWTGSSSDTSLCGVVRQHQHTVQPGSMDPLTLRCELTYPDYLLEPQSSQCDLLTGPVPGPPDSSHHSSGSAPWFTNEPIPSSIMPGDVHVPLASIWVPWAMDHQQFQEGLTLTQPVMCNVSREREVDDPCEPGLVFLALQSGPTHSDNGPAQGKDGSVLGTPSQIPQYYETACSLYEYRHLTTDMQPQAPPARPLCVGPDVLGPHSACLAGGASLCMTDLDHHPLGGFDSGPINLRWANWHRTARTLCESKSRKPCHCKRSRCLKFYCECFANGVMCNNCDCTDCHNNAEHELKHQNTIKSCLGRDPDAFRSKIAGRKSREVKGWHNKGCNCKRSGCLKMYCDCYEANIMCTSSCKCVGCENYDDGSETGVKETTVNFKNKSVITPAVVEAVCDCLLARAEEAEMEARSNAEAEHMVLEEFGHCLSQIVNAMFKDKTN